MLLYAPPLSPLSQLFHSRLHRKVMNDSSGLRGGVKGQRTSSGHCEHLKLWGNLRMGTGWAAAAGWLMVEKMQWMWVLKKKKKKQVPLWPHHCFVVSKGLWHVAQLLTSLHIFLKKSLKKGNIRNYINVKRMASNKHLYTYLDVQVYIYPHTDVF